MPKPGIYHAHGDRWLSPIAPAIDPNSGSPRPSSSALVIGFQTPSRSPGGFAQAYADVGQPMIRREYETWPSSWATSGAAQDTSSATPVPCTAISLQPPGMTGDFNNGVYDSQFLAFWRSVPPGHRTIGTIWHEPENQIFTNHDFTLQNWKDANVHAGRLVHSLGRPELEWATCWMGATFRSDGITKWGPADQWWDSRFATACDYFCCDSYFDISGCSFGSSTLTAGLKPFEDFCTTHNMKKQIWELAINETHVNAADCTSAIKTIADPVTGQPTTEKAVFEENLYTRLKNNAWAGCIYFDVPDGVHASTDSTFVMRSSSYAMNKWKSIMARQWAA